MQYDKFSWHDFCDAINGRNIVLFGGAETGKIFLKEYEGQFCVTGIYDNGEQKWGTNLLGITIDNPEKMLELDTEKTVCIITSQYWYEISQQIKKYGIKYYFVYPTIEKNKNLKEENFEGKNEYKYIWDLEYNCYAHALGAIDGIKYTNSADAFHTSLKAGFKIFETDLSLVDNEVICCHGTDVFSNIRYTDGRSMEKNIYNTYDAEGWPSSFEQLEKEKVYGRYQPLKFADICELVEKYSDIYFVLDLQYKDFSQYIELVSRMKSVLDKFPKNIEERFIVEVSSERALEEIQKRIGFKRYVFLFWNKPMKSIMALCQKCGIGTAIVEYRQVDEAFLDFFHKRNCKVGIYGEISKEKVKKLLNMGVDLVCTDEMEYII